MIRHRRGRRPPTPPVRGLPAMRGESLTSPRCCSSPGVFRPVVSHTAPQAGTRLVRGHARSCPAEDWHSGTGIPGLNAVYTGWQAVLAVQLETGRRRIARTRSHD